MDYDILIQLFISIERVMITLCCMYMRNIPNHVPALCNILRGNYKVVNLLRCPLTVPFMKQYKTINLQMFILLIPGL